MHFPILFETIYKYDLNSERIKSFFKLHEEFEAGMAQADYSMQGCVQESILNRTNGVLTYFSC